MACAYRTNKWLLYSYGSPTIIYDEIFISRYQQNKIKLSKTQIICDYYLQMSSGLILVGKNSGGFHHVLGSGLGPWDLFRVPSISTKQKINQQIAHKITLNLESIPIYIFTKIGQLRTWNRKQPQASHRKEGFCRPSL